MNMSKTIYPANNAEFLIWLVNFITVAAANKVVLGLTDGQVTVLENLRAEFSTQLNEQQAKREAAIAATTLVNGSRKLLNSEIGSLNAIFKANKSVAPELLEEMGLNAGGDSVVSSVPVAPVDLVVSGSSDGTNKLKFGNGGNRPRTIYVIEAQIGDSPNYVFVAVTSKTRFDHKNQKPGVRVFYRVKAVNGDLESAYSNIAVIYN
jgi:hypothetical protein